MKYEEVGRSGKIVPQGRCGHSHKKKRENVYHFSCCGWSDRDSNPVCVRLQCMYSCINPLNPELNPICYLLALLAHHFLHVSRIRVKSLTNRLLMSYIYIYMERLFLMFLDHTQRRTTVGRTPLDE